MTSPGKDCRGGTCARPCSLPVTSWYPFCRKGRAQVMREGKRILKENSTETRRRTSSFPGGNNQHGPVRGRDHPHGHVVGHEKRAHFGVVHSQHYEVVVALAGLGQNAGGRRCRLADKH